MPEGPEVFALAAALKALGTPAVSYGKHLFLPHLQEDWSFGLSGRVALHDGVLTKVKAGLVNGRVDAARSISDVVNTHTLGVDWLTAPAAALQRVVRGWGRSRKSLAALLLDQAEIAGVGVAWGSEVLAAAGLDPRSSAVSQAPHLERLAEALVRTRTAALEVYRNYVARSDAEAVVNGWFRNLYGIRRMAVYKIGEPVVVAGRKWWV